MGKVFTPEELERGFIPQEGAHLEAAEYIVDQLFREREPFSDVDEFFAYLERDIDAGLIHGSVTHGTANRRSDVDVVVIYLPHTPAMDTIRNVFDVARANYKVPIEANLISRDDALSGMHSIDPLFLRYLLAAQENPDFSWNNPAGKLSIGMPNAPYSDERLARVVQRYIGAKSASFSKALVAEEIDAHKLQRAFELPKNLGRKVLSMKSEDFEVAEHTGDDIVRLFTEFVTEQDVPDHRIIQINSGMKYLLEQDQDYSEFLQETIDGLHSIAAYRSWLAGPESRCVLNTALAVSQGMGSVIDQYIRQPSMHETEFIDEDQLPEDY